MTPDSQQAFRNLGPHYPSLRLGSPALRETPSLWEKDRKVSAQLHCGLQSQPTPAQANSYSSRYLLQVPANPGLPPPARPSAYQFQWPQVVSTATNNVLDTKFQVLPVNPDPGSPLCLPAVAAPGDFHGRAPGNPGPVSTLFLPTPVVPSTAHGPT